jgi:hypothetical protein
MDSPVEFSPRDISSTGFVSRRNSCKWCAIKRPNNIAADAFLLNLPVVKAGRRASNGKSITHLWLIRRR